MESILLSMKESSRRINQDRVISSVYISEGKVVPQVLGWMVKCFYWLSKKKKSHYILSLFMNCGSAAFMKVSFKAHKHPIDRTPVGFYGLLCQIQMQ